MNSDIFGKCEAYSEPQKARDLGIYPFFRRIEWTDGPHVRVDGRRLVMVGSNNYLGLTHDPRVIEAGQRALAEFGSGCTGSRLLNGNLALHEELEQRLAAYLGKQASLVFATGFLANQGAMGALLGRHDVVYSDAENHASILEGTRVSPATRIAFRHNDMADLERVLKATRHKFRGALIAADGVFSMSGAVFDLPAARALADRHGARLFVDDAHAMGVLGPGGRGTEHHFGMPGSADLVMGTFSKSFASAGGVLAADAPVIEYIKHRARAFLFTAAMPPAAAASVLACLDIIEREPERLAALWRNVEKMRRALGNLGFATLDSQTPIIPLLVGDDMRAFAFAQRLLEHGVFATPVCQPAVPAGGAMIRTSYMATHSAADLDHVLDVLATLGREFGLLGHTQQVPPAAAPLAVATAAARPAALAVA